MGSPIGAEPEVQAVTQSNLERVRVALSRTLQRAVSLGEIDRTRLGPLAASLTASYVGILTTAKGSAGPDTALEMIDGVETTIHDLR